MRLPNGDRAVVAMEKLVDYCLSPVHPRGRHKARVFDAVLGLTSNNAAELQTALLDAAASAEAVETTSDEYGQRYVVDFRMTGPEGAAKVRSTWIVKVGEDFPRLTSCYVL